MHISLYFRWSITSYCFREYSKSNFVCKKLWRFIYYGKKVQEIDIYYRGVGIISFPVSIEDMTIVIEKMLNERITA